jgi:hypothetical protein
MDSFVTVPSGEQAPVAVEYDDRHRGRARKLFADAFAARQFYAAKYKAGLNPKVIAASAEAPKGENR